MLEIFFAAVLVANPETGAYVQLTNGITPHATREACEQFIQGPATVMTVNRILSTPKYHGFAMAGAKCIAWEVEAGE